MNDQVQRLRDILQLQEEKPKANEAELLAVTSGKGGTGKTFIALNLSVALSQLNKKILLIDMDTNLSGINILLNLYPNKTLLNFFNSESKFERIIYEYSENLHIVFGDSGRMNYPELTSSILNNMFTEIEAIRDRYDFVIFDTGAGVGDDVLKILENCNKILLIVNPEPTSVMDAYVVVKLLSGITDTEKILVIINKARGLMEGQKAFDNLSIAVNHFLKKELELLGVIEYDDSVYKSIMEQEILYQHFPFNKVSQAIKNIAFKFNS